MKHQTGRRVNEKLCNQKGGCSKTTVRFLSHWQSPAVECFVDIVRKDAEFTKVYQTYRRLFSYWMRNVWKTYMCLSENLTNEWQMDKGTVDYSSTDWNNWIKLGLGIKNSRQLSFTRDAELLKALLQRDFSKCSVQRKWIFIMLSGCELGKFPSVKSK